MRNPVQTRHFKLWGFFRLAISADHSGLAAALASRLRRFTSAGAEDVDFRFEFHRTSEAEQWAGQRNLGRVVLEHPHGAVTYRDEEDRMHLNFRDWVKVLCEPGLGRTRTMIRHSKVDTVLWHVSHPLFTIPLFELLRRSGLFGLHAASLSLDDRVILFPGSSGCGKSTLSLTLLRAGFDFLGDDIAFLKPEDSGLQILGFPDEINLTEETVDFFPELGRASDLPRVPGSSKRQVRPETFYGAKCLPKGRPALIAFPTVLKKKGRRSRLARMDPGEALVELAPNVLLTEARRSQGHLDAIAQLVRHSDCYRLEVGSDFDRLPMLMREVLG